MEFTEFYADSKKYLSEIPLNDQSSIIDNSVYLELILNGPFRVWEENGELEIIQVKARVAKFRNLIITVNPNEHPPPHFHVKTGSINASFTIGNCSKIAGDIKPSDLKKLKYWYSKSNSRDKLIEIWNATRPTKCVVGKFQEGSM